MVEPKPRYPLSHLVIAWALATALEFAWATGLYNYDGEMGDTPPSPMMETLGISACAATFVVALAWGAWRLFNRRQKGLWLALFFAFIAEGSLFAGLSLLSLAWFGPSAFTTASFYRGAAISIATALVDGLIVAGLVRMLEVRFGAADQLNADIFD